MKAKIDDALPPNSTEPLGVAIHVGNSDVRFTDPFAKGTQGLRAISQEPSERRFYYDAIFRLFTALRIRRKRGGS